MNYATIKGANAWPGAPKDWDAERDGPCGVLPVRVARDGDRIQHCESAWKPTPEELSILLGGGVIILRNIGWQVPVALYVATSDEIEEPKSGT